MRFGTLRGRFVLVSTDGRALDVETASGGALPSDARQALAMELRVNGEVRQSGNTAQMVISIPHLVAYHSAQGYSAGDIITTGTISGVAAVQPNPFDFYLRPGDRIEAEIEGIGVLRNQVVPWSAAHDTPPYTTDLYSSTAG